MSGRPHNQSKAQESVVPEGTDKLSHASFPSPQLFLTPLPDLGTDLNLRLASAAPIYSKAIARANWQAVALAMHGRTQRWRSLAKAYKHQLVTLLRNIFRILGMAAGACSP
jgi:hypothetical protein